MRRIPAIPIARVLLLLGLGAALPLAAQAPPMPDHPQLREAYLAWDRGAYPTALRGYLAVLEGPDGAVHLEEIARLTGELHPVVEVAPDGRAVEVASDGSVGTFVVVEDGRERTKVVAMASGRITATLDGVGARPGPGGRVAFRRVEPTAAVLAARAAEGRAQSRQERLQAAMATRWEEARASVTVEWRDGSEHVIEVEGAPLDFAYDPAGVLTVAAAPHEDPGLIAIYEVHEGVARALPIPAGPKLGWQVTERHVVYSTPGRVVTVERAGGATASFEGYAPSVAADGSTLAFLVDVDGGAHVEAVPLGAGGAGAALRVAEAVGGPPAVSPDGRWIAYQKRPHDDWEVFVAAADGSGERQLSLEIQHDRSPMWIDAERVLAAKGEGRHMRSYVYHVAGGEPLKLFHNNTVRTIAPEYEWAAAPGSGRILIVSERDGDTVSPERGVYLLDLRATLTRADVVARLRSNLEAETDLRARGEAMFAPVAERAAAVADAISVARIYQAARDVYAFGSKHIQQPGNHPAIEYYTAALRSYGYEPEVQWFETRGVRTANVIARIPGTVDPELVYVASSHFDSVERGPGADDNSSGSTALLEVARVLRNHPLPATVELAFFTGEEAGLLGSREYVRRAVESGKRIVGALNNDMVGWANDHRLDNTIRYSNPGIRDIQHAAAMQFSELITYDALYYKSTDAAAYYEAYGDIVGGIGSYPVLGNPHYHQVTDRLETINQRLVAEVARTTAATLVLLASSPARVNGLVVESGVARWTPSSETGVTGYQVRWRTPQGWREVGASGARIELPGHQPGGEVWVRARRENGTVGWDWARAGG